MAKKKRKSYDDDFRASAVVMLESQGYPDTIGALSAVASHLNVPYRTLSRWYRKEQNPPPDQLVQFKKGEFVGKLNGLLDLFADRMKEEAADAPLRELSTAFGITFDKVQLLQGDPTERNETRIKLKWQHDTED